MDPFELEDAYLAIFGVKPPTDRSRMDIAELVLEGLSPLLHGEDIFRRCLTAIIDDQTLPAPIREWAEQDLAIATH